MPGGERLELLDRRGRGGIAAEIRRTAAEIVEGIRGGGDAALLEAVRRFDGFDAPSVGELRLGGAPGNPGGAIRATREPPRARVIGRTDGTRASSPHPVLGTRASSPHPVLGTRASSPHPASDEVDPDVLSAIERARTAIEVYHRAQPHGPGVQHLERDGVSIEERRLPIRRVGIYVPGGRFPYPSTVLMTAVPARLAGVEELVIATPPLAYLQSPVLRYVLDLAGADEVWGMGGAHAVAAFAYGTGSIRAVDLIVGPGNAWVAAAKQHVAGDVGVDRDAGPSEVVIVATDGAPASWVAADLLAQAEHDPLAVAVLVTDSAALAERVAAEVDRQLAQLATADTAAAALEAHGAAFVADDLEGAPRLGRTAGARASATHRRGRGSARGQGAPCRCGVRGRSVAGGVRGLRGRTQPRAAHRRQRALRLRPRDRGLRAAQSHGSLYR